MYWNILIRNANKLTVSVTHRCNMRCKTCGIWKLNNPQPRLTKKELKLSDYEDFFALYNKWHWISFTGGEPFLRKDLADIVLAAYEKCRTLHTITIPTNGYPTTKIVKDVQEVLFETKLPNIHVSVSLDGLRSLHDSLRGCSGSFEKVLATFKTLKSIGDKRLHVHLEYTISRFNQGRLFELVDSLASLNITANDFILSLAQNSSFYFNESCHVKADDDVLKSEITRFLSTLKIRSLHDLVQWMFLRHIIKDRRIPCVAGRRSFHLNPYGEIFSCISNPKRIGSIREGILGKPNLPSNCYCYTPCESFFSLILHLPESLFLSL